MFSDFTSDRLYFPNHFIYNKYDDCHRFMALFKAPVTLSTIVLESYVIGNIFPIRIYRNGIGGRSYCLTVHVC